MKTSWRDRVLTEGVLSTNAPTASGPASPLCEAVTCMFYGTGLPVRMTFEDVDLLKLS